MLNAAFMRVYFLLIKFLLFMTNLAWIENMQLVCLFHRYFRFNQAIVLE